MLTEKKNLRLMEVAPLYRGGGVETRPISGGLLMQQRDTIEAEGKDADGNATGDDPTRWRLVAGGAGRRGHAGRPDVRLARDPAR